MTGCGEWAMLAITARPNAEARRGAEVAEETLLRMKARSAQRGAKGAKNFQSGFFAAFAVLCDLCVIDFRFTVF